MSALKSAKSVDRRLAGAVIFWVVVALLALNAGRLVFTRPAHSQTQAPPTVAYTVMRTESVFDRAGVLKHTNYYVEAMRSDGSKMWRGATGAATDRKIDLASGDHVRTNETLGLKSTYPNLHGGAPVRRNPQAYCETSDDLKAGWVRGSLETVGGHQAVSMARGGSQRTMTVWYALDAGCAMLQLRSQHETGLTEQNLAALVLGEPDPALFQVPATFQEVPPSRLHGACPEADSGCKSLPDSVKNRLDAAYSRARAAAAPHN